MQFSLGNITVDVDDRASGVIKWCTRAFTAGAALREKACIQVVVDEGPVINQQLLIDRFAAIGDAGLVVLDSLGAGICFDPESLLLECTTIWVTPKSDPTKVFVNILEPILRIKLLFLDQTVLVHASGIADPGGALLFPAWGGTGKTNLLLHFLLKGISIYGDDLVPLTSEGVVLPYPKPINLFDYNLAAYPSLRQGLGVRYSLLSFMKRSVERTLRIWSAVVSRHSLSVKALAKVAEYAKGAVNVKIPANEINATCRIPEPRPLLAAMNLVKGAGDRVLLQEIAAGKLAERMVACHSYEWRRFGEYLAAYRFATGKVAAPDTAEIESAERALMSSQFGRVPLFEVTLPKGGMTAAVAGEIAQMIRAHGGQTLT